MVVLPSGRQIVVREETRQVSANERATLDVDYVTEYENEAIIAVAHEVLELWAYFLDVAERDGIEQVLIIAHHGRFDEHKTGFAFWRTSSGSWNEPEVLPLRSGKRVVIISADEESSSTEVFMLDYATALPLRPRCGLIVEAEEVWFAFRERAEAFEAQKVIVSAHDAPLGRNLMTFAFTRTADGEWHRPFC